MKHLVRLHINLDKLERKHVFRGRKGRWTDLLLIETPESPYGHPHMVVQGVSKEDSDAGINGPIVGNTKIFEVKPKQ